MRETRPVLSYHSAAVNTPKVQVSLYSLTLFRVLRKPASWRYLDPRTSFSKATVLSASIHLSWYCLIILLFFHNTYLYQRKQYAYSAFTAYCPSTSIQSLHIFFPGIISAHYIVASTIVLVSSSSSPSVLVSLLFHQPNPALSSSIRHSRLDLHTVFQDQRPPRGCTHCHQSF